jgi:hypothetical protein
MRRSGTYACFVWICIIDCVLDPLGVGLRRSTSVLTRLEFRSDRVLPGGIDQDQICSDAAQKRDMRRKSVTFRQRGFCLEYVLATRDPSLGVYA